MNFTKFFANLNGIHEAIQNPKKAGQEYVKGIVQGYLIVWGTWLVGITAVLALFGFTELLDGPYRFAEVLFYIWIVLIGLGLLGIFMTWRLIKRKWQDWSDNIRKQRATKVEVIDVEYIEN